MADGRATALDTRPPLMVYVPYWFNNEGKSVLIAHVAGDSAAAIRDMRRAIMEVDASATSSLIPRAARNSA